MEKVREFLDKKLQIPRTLSVLDETKCSVCKKKLFYYRSCYEETPKWLSCSLCEKKNKEFIYEFLA